MRDFFQDSLDLHNLYREARLQRAAYFEKLAILDGGTVALVITAVLGSLHGTAEHKVLLVAGVAFLLLALLVLLLRNLMATEIEYYVAARTAHDPVLDNSKVADRYNFLRQYVPRFERAGIALSVSGMLALGVEACLILSR